MNDNNENSLALEGIRKKLVGKTLTYKEIYAIMDEIAQEKLGNILTTYFAASGYSKGFTDQEIYYLTKAMIETGEQLHFPGIVADKHSIGGVPGTRTTLIVVPIIAAAGFTIPKSSSRAITTPSGTGDDMEVLAPVSLSRKDIYRVVAQTNGCIVWGGSVNIAPADDVLIKVEAPLMFESFDKILVSIMAKKIAFGSNHIVIDLPYGENVKVHSLADAQRLKQKFLTLAEKFCIKLKVLCHRVEEPAGRGIGPVLETRDALRVLEQSENRPLDLEERALYLASELLELCLKDSPEIEQKRIKTEFSTPSNWAKHLLNSGLAHQKMLEIIKSQGGDGTVKSHDLNPGRYHIDIKTKHGGKIKQIDSRNLTIIAKILGAPKVKKAGIYLEKKIGENVQKDDIIFTLFSESAYHLEEAEASLKHFPFLIF